MRILRLRVGAAVTRRGRRAWRLLAVLTTLRKAELEGAPQPSIRELAAAAGSSASTALSLCRELEAGGLIRMGRRQARSQRTTPELRDALEELLDQPRWQDIAEAIVQYTLPEES